MISVIMSVYNETIDELRESICSIIDQTYKNLEIIIVNDNPERIELDEILSAYANKDKRVVILKNDRNIGLAESLNRALCVAHGKYIARMDADDISFLNRIEYQADYLDKNPDIDIVATNRIDINENSDPIGYDTDFNFHDNDLKVVLRFGSVIIHPTVMARSAFYNDIGGYNNFKAAQDYDLWLRAIAHGYNIHILPEKLLYYRVRENSISNLRIYRQFVYTQVGIDNFKNHYKLCAPNGIMSQYDIDEAENRYRMNDKRISDSFSKQYRALHKAWEVKQYLRFLLIMLSSIRCPIVYKSIFRDFYFKKTIRQYLKKEEVTNE